MVLSPWNIIYTQAMKYLLLKGSGIRFWVLARSDCDGDNFTEGVVENIIYSVVCWCCIGCEGSDRD